MPHFIVRHSIADFDRWKPIFDEDRAARQAHGSQGGRLFRNAENPNDLVIVWKWADLDQARGFAAAPGLREKMQAAGVTSRPELFFLDQAEEIPV
jgi:hypothetical protein